MSTKIESRINEKPVGTTKNENNKIPKMKKVTKVTKVTKPKTSRKKMLESPLKKTALPVLEVEKSIKLNAQQLRERIDKLATEFEDNKGIKYLNLKEFEECESIQKDILQCINKSRKIAILTGAGISCNAGIPDFRSDNGLYNKKLNERNVRIKMKGKDMFDVSVYRSLETVEIFNNFIYELYQQVLQCKPTRTHEFIRKLNDKNKLIKCYTQNIDGLERNCGLRTEFDCKDWNNSDVIQLHGDLHQLCCNSCKFSYQWNEIYDEKGNVKFERTCANEEPASDIGSGEENDDLLIFSQTTNMSDSQNSIFSKKGENDSMSSVCEMDTKEKWDDNHKSNLIECPKCVNNYENKMRLGKRCLESSIGIIRPNIVLYGEEHPYSETFAKNLNKDLNKKPNILLIFGTSLKVEGVKNLVRKMSKKIHENDKGMVILVNKDPISQSSWKNYIDFQVVSDCDAFCELIESKLPNIFGNIVSSESRG